MGDEEPGMGDFWEATSYGAISIVDPVITGWYTMPYPREQYLTEGIFDQTAATEDCTALADSAVNFPDFDGINLMMNDSLGGVAIGGSWTFALDGVSKVYDMTWLTTFEYENQYVLAHEMGHAVGLPHSSGPYDGVYDSFWDVMRGGGTCAGWEPVYGYRDVEAIAVHKDMLGWINPARRYVEAGNVGRHYYQWRYEQPAIEDTIGWTRGQGNAAGVVMLYPATGEPVNLTNATDWDSGPAWSPNGTMIAFSRGRVTVGEEIFIMNAHGTNPRNLTILTGADYAPTWR